MKNLREDDQGIEHTWARIEAWLSIRAPAILCVLQGGAKVEDIAAFESLAGSFLPDEVKLSYSIHDGQCAPQPGLMGGWEFLSVKRMGDLWLEKRRIVENSQDEEFAFNGLTMKGNIWDERVVDAWWDVHWIPVAYNWAGDYYYLDLAPAPGGINGQVVEALHDPPMRTVVAPGFGAWLAGFAKDLETGRYVYRQKGNGGYLEEDDLF